jgi:hypothetical protein
MRFLASMRRNGIFHVSAVVAVLAALMLASHFGESINGRINANSLPTHDAAAADLLARCMADSAPTSGCGDRADPARISLGDAERDANG